MTDREFHHYAYVRMGNTHKLFFDGVVVATDSFIGNPGHTSGLPLVIGSGPSRGQLSQLFSGVIDEVQIFNRALSDAEIEDIIVSGKPEGRYTLTAHASYKGSERTAVVTVVVE